MNYMPQNFKTSHVIVYLFYPGYRHLISGISKHLMLLFIFSPSALSTGNTLFQNISCYCLSIQLPKKRHRNGHFKTSHVIVYLRPGTAFQNVQDISKHLMLLFIFFGLSSLPPPIAFQNISCYCLSLSAFSSTNADASFQNISCYCLSHNPFQESVSVSDFKTSHVIVYQAQKAL